MLKGLIGKKIGMTQIFDENGVAYRGDDHRSWALLRYPGAPPRERRLLGSATRFRRGQPQTSNGR